MTDGKVVSYPAEAVLTRLFNRKQAARYMGRSLRKFDQIKHLFRTVEPDGSVYYDQMLMDMWIDLNRAAA